MIADADAQATVGLIHPTGFAGLGKARYKETVEFWIPDALECPEFVLVRTGGVHNLPDMLTKPVP